jgi:hypothetical protein
MKYPPIPSTGSMGRSSQDPLHTPVSLAASSQGSKGRTRGRCVPRSASCRDIVGTRSTVAPLPRTTKGPALQDLSHAPERIRTSDLRFRRPTASATDMALRSQISNADSPKTRQKLDHHPARTRSLLVSRAGASSAPARTTACRPEQVSPGLAPETLARRPEQACAALPLPHSHPAKGDVCGRVVLTTASRAAACALREMLRPTCWKRLRSRPCVTSVLGVHSRADAIAAVAQLRLTVPDSAR